MNTTPTGRLIYVIGPSGAGKDTLIQYVREHKSDGLPLLFAHRYITRPADAGGENHVALTVPEFQLRKSHDLFALDWGSHGNYYGIGKEIDQWLSKGLSVVVNGSRGYLPNALARYPDMHTMLVEVSEEVLYHRLMNRGRESETEILKRIERSGKFNEIDAPNLCRINNDKDIHVSGEAFLEVVKGLVL